MKTLFTLFAVLASIALYANDGAYFASGNQLIPIEETEIAITKEILTIRRLDDGYLKVTVDYTFMNPGEAKSILVGFEAASPSGDVNATPKYGRHPYMEEFSAIINGNLIPHEVAVVNSENYYTNGTMQNISVQDIMAKDQILNYVDFYYVYHFQADFKPGENKIIHEYKFKISGSVEMSYEFDYILTAANRWANKQIDDFTLNLDLGGYNEFYVSRSFFDDTQNWSGAVKLMDGDNLPYMLEDRTPMRVISGDIAVQFKAKNFHPKGELRVYAPRAHSVITEDVFDAQKVNLPYNVENFTHLIQSSNDISQKILRNLPFARRGYVFKNQAIQEYYDNLDWYSPDPTYEAKLELLTPQEQAWLEKLREEHH